VWIRVRNITASRRFYELIAPLVRIELTHAESEIVGFRGRGPSFFFLVQSEQPTENIHLAFPAPDDAMVDEFHRLALAAGYRDNGAPGERPEYHAGYYGAYVLDPDGHNVEVVCHNRD
jgi:catechol 2,3-dioxygenase-like lactoylglutathione lyase family enzyme